MAGVKFKSSKYDGIVVKSNSAFAKRTAKLNDHLTTSTVTVRVM
jgi:hypothetical protein